MLVQAFHRFNLYKRVIFHRLRFQIIRINSFLMHFGIRAAFVPVECRGSGG